MIITDTRPHVLSNIKVDVAFQNLEQKIKTSDNSSQILGTAERALDKAKGLWKPMAVYQWFEFENTGRDNLGSIIQNSGSRLNFDFGYSSKFLMDTRHALVTVYTVGQELEQESMNASSKGDLLEAYFLDLIGLIVLEKVEQIVKEIAEKQARYLGWGVSPFLSPGSIHGWELAQIDHCQFPSFFSFI